MLKTTFVAVSVFIFLPLLAGAQSKVSDCQGNLAEANVVSLNPNTEVKSLDQLPKKIFVAQSADYFVSSKTSEMKLWGRQSFMTGEGKILCATLKDSVQRGFSIYAPTLIDLSEAHSVGNSFWQFHMTANEQKAGIWNQKSHFAPHTNDFLQSLQENGIKIYGEMISPTRYQLHFLRENSAFIEHLRIRYDLTSDLP